MVPLNGKLFIWLGSEVIRFPFGSTNKLLRLSIQSNNLYLSIYLYIVECRGSSFDDYSKCLYWYSLQKGTNYKCLSQILLTGFDPEPSGIRARRSIHRYLFLPFCHWSISLCISSKVGRERFYIPMYVNRMVKFFMPPTEIGGRGNYICPCPSVHTSVCPILF